MVKKIILVVLIWKVMLVSFSYLGQRFIPFNPTFTAFKNTEVLPKPLPYWLVVFANFDGIHYIQIAQRGYHQLEQPFFPFFPILIRFTHLITNIPYVVSGQVVSIGFLILSLGIVYKLLVLINQKHLYTLYILAALLFPTSFFYSAVYNDSLFLFLSLITIYAAARKKWLFSGLFAAIATLTRLNGLALTIFLFTEYALSSKKLNIQWRINTIIHSFRKMITLNSIIKDRIYLFLLPILAFVGYLWYVNAKFGDWNLVFSTMKIWNQHKITLLGQVFWRYFKILVLYPSWHLNYFVALFELFFVFFYIVVLTFSFKKIKLSYWVFTVVSLLIPTFTGTFAGMPRYGLHLYPFFLSLTLFLNKKTRLFKVVYFSLMILVEFIFLALFTRGYFIS